MPMPTKGVFVCFLLLPESCKRVTRRLSFQLFSLNHPIVEETVAVTNMFVQENLLLLVQTCELESKRHALKPNALGSD